MRIMEIDPITMSLWELQGRKLQMWDRDDIEKVVERVNRGANLLDNHEGPRWSDRVAPSDLDMSSGEFCIIGQAYNGYGAGIAIPFGLAALNENEHGATVDDRAIEHGFLTECRGEEIPFMLLDRVWVYMLEQRSFTSDEVQLTVPPAVALNKMETLVREADLYSAVVEC